jgi:hypothetical protein
MGSTSAGNPTPSESADHDERRQKQIEAELAKFGL